MQIDTNKMDFIATSIKSYDIHVTIDPVDNPFDRYCSSNVLMYAFHTGQIFQYEANFLDFKQRKINEKSHSARTMLDILIEIFRKLGGILVKGRADQKPLLKIVTKYSIHEKYMLKEHTPIYPDGKPSEYFSAHKFISASVILGYV